MTNDEIKKLFKKRDQLIKALNDRLDNNIAESQKKLLALFIEKFADKLQLDENKQVLNNQYNRNLLLSVDKLFTDFSKINNPIILDTLLTSVGTLMEFNHNYYSNLESKAKLLPIKAKVFNSLKGWLGVEDNIVKPNGYLDVLVKNDSVKNQIKNTVLKTVYGQEGWESTKKALSKLIAGDAENLGALQKYHRNFTYDLYSQIDRATGKAYADDLGFEFAIYEGGLIETSREFCKEHNGNVYHKSEIADFDPKVAKQPDYNPFTDLGGYGCRHHLNWVPTALARALRPDIDKFL